MRPRTQTRLAMSTLLALPFLASIPANPGVRFEITTTDHTTSPARVDVGEVLVEGSNVAMSVRGPENDGRMIYRGGDGTMIVVDDGTRSYMVMDKAAVAGLSDQMSNAMSQMDRMLESLPPEQQAMIRKAREQGGMPGMPPVPKAPEVEVRKTGNRDTRQGYSADEYEVFEDGLLARRVWVAPWSEIEGGAEARSGLMAMAASLEEFLKALPTMPGAQGPLARNPFGGMDIEGGLPVLTLELGPDGQVERETAVTAVETRSIEPGAFEAPAGYTPRSMRGG
jgi:hypothetical protein